MTQRATEPDSHAPNPAELQASSATKQTPRRRRTQRNAGPRKDLYQDVTDNIIGQLEAGSVPWVQPWGRPGVNLPLALPQNAHTGRTYSGINILLLWSAAIDTNRTTQTWLTYKQAKDMGAQVRKGERGTTVCYASTFIPKIEKLRAQETGNDPQQVGFLKRYTVFNADQCEGLPDEFFKHVPPMPEREIIPRAETLIKATKAKFKSGGDRAFYVPSQDFIQVPHQHFYFEQINYYRTCFHELGHWTGHKSRLDRNLTGSNSSKSYAKEELVAEMTTAFVCAALNIKPTVRHSDYIAAWLKILKNDKRFVFRAASLASKAADYILAFENPLPTESQSLEVAA